MGIKRQKASAIMQSLLIDIAATGSFEALAIIKKAWTMESSRNNLQDALGELNDAIKHTDALLKVMSYLVREGYSPSIRVNSSVFFRGEFALVEQQVENTKKTIEEMIGKIEKGLVDLNASPTNYWRESGHLLLNEIHDKLGALVESSFKYTALGETNLDFAYNTLRDDLTDARDEIENAMEAAGIDPSAAPSAAPATAPAGAPSGASAVEKDKAYMDYIFGAHKLLDKFLEEYASGDLTPEQDAIIRRLIMDNADSKKLMSAYLKWDNEHEQIKMFKDPSFSNKAKVLFDKIKANIATATTELDKLGQL